MRNKIQHDPVAVTVRLPLRVHKAVDKAKGSHSASSFIAHAVAEKLSVPMEPVKRGRPSKK